MEQRKYRLWQNSEIDKLKELWDDGVPVKDIAVLLGRTPRSIGRYVDKNRAILELKRRDKLKCALAGQKEYWQSKTEKTFENAWRGVVPLGHWMITKPWRS